jgi:tRNA U34 5-methylaminomethyl-2-thiouridine-forming methyltransferase MnmC
MDRPDLEKSLSRWPQLCVEADELASQWHPQFEMLEFQINNVHLSVYFSDANVRLPQLDIQADAWFLDGFSPAKNPELWNADLIQQVFHKTGPEGTFATYTSAGWVRQNLQSAGFTVQRIRGHGNKRQMTICRKSS